MTKYKRTEITADSLGDTDFIDFSSMLRTEMDSLDGSEWQAAEDLRQDCRMARVYNNADARRRVAAAINARSLVNNRLCSLCGHPLKIIVCAASDPHDPPVYHCECWPTTLADILGPIIVLVVLGLLFTSLALL